MRLHANEVDRVLIYNSLEPSQDAHTDWSGKSSIKTSSFFFLSPNRTNPATTLHPFSKTITTQPRSSQQQPTHVHQLTFGWLGALRACICFCWDGYLQLFWLLAWSFSFIYYKEIERVRLYMGGCEIDEFLGLRMMNSYTRHQPLI